MSKPAKQAESLVRTGEKCASFVTYGVPNPAPPPGQNATPSPGPEMPIEWRPLDSITPYARNARHIPEAAIAKVAASLKAFGWRQPIVVDKDGVIVAGHVRYLAARRNGYTQVPVHVALDLSPSQIKAYRLADNRSHEEATWNQEMLGIELLELKAEQFEIDLTGFERHEIIENIFGGPDETGESDPDAGAAQLSGLEYRVVVDCRDEAHQTELLDRFKQEELPCRALIS